MPAAALILRLSGHIVCLPPCRSPSPSPCSRRQKRLKEGLPPLALATKIVRPVARFAAPAPVERFSLPAHTPLFLVSYRFHASMKPRVQFPRGNINRRSPPKSIPLCRTYGSACLGFQRSCNTTRKKPPHSKNSLRFAAWRQSTGIFFTSEAGSLWKLSTKHDLKLRPAVIMRIAKAKKPRPRRSQGQDTIPQAFRLKFLKGVFNHF